MRNIGRIIIVTILMFGDAASQTANTPIQSFNNAAIPNPKMSLSDSEEVKIGKQQIKILEEQLKTTKEYESALLETVYWALSGVFVVVGLLLGFGWFANFKVYERDRDSLKSDIDATIRSKAEELIQLIKAEIEAREKELNVRVDRALSKSEQSLKKSITDVESRLLSLELNVLKEKMKTNPSKNMALTDAIAVLTVCSKKQLDDVPDTIHFMLKNIDEGGKMTASEITRVNAILDNLPQHYKALTDRLRDKLVASDIF